MVVPLAMGWRDLLFANWAVDPGAVAARLPEPLDVDTFDGRAWLSAIPFTNVDLRPRGLPAALGVDVPELNLRTYVTCDGEPGIYFYSLDAASVVAVLGARLFHHLPYYYAAVESRRRDDRTAFRARRRQRGDRPAAFEATYGPEGEAFVPEESTLASFLADRFRFFALAPDGAVRYTDVSHQPWTLHPAAADVSRNTLVSAAGFESPDREPVCFYSPGVDVVASRSRRWAGRGG